MRGVQEDGVAQQVSTSQGAVLPQQPEREPAMKWACESEPKDEAKQRKQKATFFVLNRFHSLGTCAQSKPLWPSLSLSVLLIHPRVLWHAGSSCVPFLSTPLCPSGWSPPPGHPAHRAAPIKTNVFPCFWARQHITPSWLAHIGLRHRHGLFEACDMCAFLWCTVLIWPHPQTRCNSTYNIILTIRSINYIHCLLSIACNKTTSFHGSLTPGTGHRSLYSSSFDALTVQTWLPVEFDYLQPVPTE